MIIVTGATGTIGKDVVKGLQGMGAPFKVVARGVTQHHNAIEAAKATRIAHVVRLSAMGAETGSKISLGRWHGQADEELKRSGGKWTILQPHSFMQNLLNQAGTIKQQGAIYGSFRDGKIAMIDTRDIARVAAHALVDPGHEGKIYVLTGPQAVSYTQVAETFSRVLRKPVKYADVPPEHARPAMLGMGMPAWLVDDLLELASIFAAGRGAQVTDAVEKVGKAKLHTIEQFVRDYAHAFS